MFRNSIPVFVQYHLLISLDSVQVRFLAHPKTTSLALAHVHNMATLALKLSGRSLLYSKSAFRIDAQLLACGSAASVYDLARTLCCSVVHDAFVCSPTHHHHLHSGTRLPQQCANCPPNFNGPLAYISMGGAQGPLNFTHRSCLRARCRLLSNSLPTVINSSVQPKYSNTNDISRR